VNALHAQILSTHSADPSSVKGKEGAFYYLPSTVLKVEVTVYKTEQIRGPYSEYAYKFLGLDQVVTANSVLYELGPVKVHPVLVPDPDQKYFAEFLNRQSKDPQPLIFDLTQEGFIRYCGIGITSTMEETEETVYTGEEAVQDIEPDKDRFHYYATNNQIVKVDTLIKMVTIDTSTFKDISYRTSLVYKTLEQRAAEASSQIELIREERFKLLTGYQEVNYSMDALSFMESKFKDMENQYLSLFKGLKITTEYHYTLVYVPIPNKSGQPEVLFKFTPDAGIKESSHLSGDAVSITVAPFDEEAVKLNPANESISSFQGVVYRIPERSRVSVSFKGHEIRSDEVYVSQYGRIAGYPASGKFHIRFNRETGSIQQVRIE
jgi:hypothetical protein